MKARIQRLKGDKKANFCTLALPLLGMLFLRPALLHACPGCAEAMDATVSEGFNKSVLFLMSMPFFVFGSILAGFFFANRRNADYSTTQ